MRILSINDLTCSIEGKTILSNLNLNINSGEIHAVMGPNGVGKSTLSKVIMGDNHYQIKNGTIIYKGEDITNIETYKRSRMGIFLAMQNPIAIPGISNQDFLKTALSAKLQKPVGLYDFMLKCETAISDLKMDKNLIHRGLNDGFSGGERKKNEVLQLKILEPSLIILDELDSGLDVDSLKIVSENISDYINKNKDTAVLIITHYPKILQYLSPDFVHILYNGKIAYTSTKELALEIEKNGYKNIINKSNDIDGND